MFKTILGMFQAGLSGRLMLATLVGGLVAFAGTALPTSAQAETKLLFNRFVPAKHPFNSGLFQPWAKDVARVTENRVTVEFTSATLAPPPKQWNMITKGIADVAMLNNVFERNRLKLPPIADLPFGGDTAVQRSVALWRTYDKFLRKANEFKGVKLLALWAISGTNIHLTNKPVLRVADLDRMKIWTNAGMPNKMLSALSAVVVTSPGVKIFNFVSKGIVDGLVIPSYMDPVFKVSRYIKYTTRIPGGLYSLSFSMFMNEKKWKRISARDQKAIMGISGEAAARKVGLEIDRLDVKSNKKAAEMGIKETVAGPEFMSEIKKKFTFVTKAWLDAAKARGIDGKAALKYYRSQF